MYSVAWSYKLIFFILLQCVHVDSVYADTQQIEMRSKKFRRQRQINREYRSIVKERRKENDKSEAVEEIASGSAAIVIGLYGYYNDDRGLLTKVVYNATVTAGVLLVSDAILSLNTSDLLLDNDRYFKNNKNMNYRKYRENIVYSSRKMKRAESKQMAYSSGILGGIYLYNSFREESKGLRNVYYFLSFNFLLVSGASFYKLSKLPMVKEFDNGVEVSMLPLPKLTWTF